MAHPAHRLFRNIPENPRFPLVHQNLRLAILPHIRTRHGSPKHMHHKLCPITKPQNRNPHLKKLPRVRRRIRLITTVRSSRQDNPLRIHRLNLLKLRLIRINLTVHIALPDTPRHKLVILSPKIQHNHQFSLHLHPSLNFHFCSFFISQSFQQPSHAAATVRHTINNPLFHPTIFFLLHCPNDNTALERRRKTELHQRLLLPSPSIIPNHKTQRPEHPIDDHRHPDAEHAHPKIFSKHITENNTEQPHRRHRNNHTSPCIPGSPER